MTQDFEKLDKIYRVSEKKEIEKFNRIGKTTREFYEQKEMSEELAMQKQEEGAAAVEEMKAKLLSEGETQVREVQGEGYE